jgi:hypothetical protein
MLACNPRIALQTLFRCNCLLIADLKIRKKVLIADVLVAKSRFSLQVSVVPCVLFMFRKSVVSLYSIFLAEPLVSQGCKRWFLKLVSN